MENQIRGRLGEVAAQACATIDPNRSPTVEVDLLEGRLLIAGLSLFEGDLGGGASIQLSGHLDTLEIAGLSVMDLLFHQRVSVRTLRIRSSDLLIRLLPIAGPEKPVPPDAVGDPWLVDVSSFYCKANTIMLITARGDTVNTSDDGLLVSGRNVQFVPGAEGSRSVDDLLLSLGGISGTLPDNYGWSIGRCVLDQTSSTFALYQASIGPRDSLEQHSTTLRFEKDVIQARIDTIQLAGLDLDKALSNSVCSLRRIILSSGEVNVLRDKTLPDGPSGKQPLLGTLLRRLPAGWGADSVSAERLNVRYRERADRARGYADIPFSQLGATITGFRSDVHDTSAYVVQAHCIAFSTAPVTMVLRGMVRDPTDRFDLNATIGAMPFSVLNQATGPLLDVRCTEGKIHSVLFHMIATDEHASGSVLMHYDGLKLTSGGRKRKETMNRLETMLLNTLVQNDHRDSNGAPGEGRFSFPRRQDRALFNYMWSGLREGTKAVLLPEVLSR
ncbi:MAG: hypothetical protein IT229_13380 [Flavobacteriales bacterium]|nr:hypothetical protein [Flavobacteriales bacterium]